jgi:hypothetical protein
MLTSHKPGLRQDWWGLTPQKTDNNPDRAPADLMKLTLVPSDPEQAPMSALLGDGMSAVECQLWSRQ